MRTTPLLSTGLAALVALAELRAQAPPTPKAGPPPAQPGMAGMPGVPAAEAGAGDFMGKPFKVWLKEIRSPDPGVRESAIRAMPYFREAAAEAVPDLLNQIQGTNDLSPLTNAVMVLGQIPIPEDKQGAVASALIHILENTGQGIIRYQAAMAVAALGPAARGATIVLSNRTLADTQSWEIRRAAAFALGRVARDAQNFPEERALAALVQRLPLEPAREVKLECLQAIIQLGPPASGAADRLKELLRKQVKVSAAKDPLADIWLRVTLMRLDPTEISEPNFKAMASHLRDPDPATVAQAAKALGYLGPLAKSKLPDLMNVLGHADPFVVVNAAWALGNMGADGRPAIQALNRLLTHKEKLVQEAAADAVKRIENPPKR